MNTKITIQVILISFLERIKPQGICLIQVLKYLDDTLHQVFLGYGVSTGNHLF